MSVGGGNSESVSVDLSVKLDFLNRVNNYKIYFDLWYRLFFVMAY